MLGLRLPFLRSAEHRMNVQACNSGRSAYDILFYPQVRKSGLQCNDSSRDMSSCAL